MNKYGEATRLNSKVDFNGLEFTMKYDLAPSGSAFGVFFTPTNAAYAPIDSAFSKLTITLWAQSDYSKICLTTSHDYHNENIVYTKPSKDSSSTHILNPNESHGSFLMNNLKDGNNKLYGGIKININSYNKDWYSITLTEVYEDNVLTSNNNYDANTRSATYYLSRSDIDFTDMLGGCYMNVFSVGGDEHRCIMSNISSTPRNNRKPEIDLYLLAGQSNMVGYSNINDETIDNVTYKGLSTQDKSLVFRNAYVYASGEGKNNHPAYFDKWSDNFSAKSIGLADTKFGPEFGLAKGLADLYTNTGTDKNVAFVKYAVGGTAMYDHWFSNFAYQHGTTNTNGGVPRQGDTPIQTATLDGKTVGDLYCNMITLYRARIAELETHYDVNVKGFFFMQGEHDSIAVNKTGAVLNVAVYYESNLTDFIAGIRNDLALSNLPVVIGQIFEKISGTAYVSTIRAAQEAVANADPLVSIVKTDKENYGTYNFFGDAHFDGVSMLKLGTNFANEIRKFN